MKKSEYSSKLLITFTPEKNKINSKNIESYDNLDCVDLFIFSIVL